VTDRLDLEIRRATPDDRPAIIDLGTRTLDWLGDAEERAFFAWKHEQNPFGPSPMWVACDGDRVVGFRTFLRWEFVDEYCVAHRAVRAVDTATDPDYQGRGIFTRLTLAALDELHDEGIEFVFNTPNQRSLPGYLKMGWRVVGRLPASVRPTSAASLVTLLRARAPASRNSVIVRVGNAPSEAFADVNALGVLLASRPRRPGLGTTGSPEYLRWRYGLDSLHYRVLLAGDSVADGFIVFRLRRRGPAIEAVICDLFTPGGRADVAESLTRRLAANPSADYLLALDHRWVAPGRFVRLPRTGPILAARPVAAAAAPLPLRRWHVTMGDIEMF
jgi:GNAT superfamily N-acetyltransferase